MFSVIIPLYNKAHTIKRTLQSVLNQTFQEFEIVIVNDGSTDNGIQVINDSFQDNRIKIFNQFNQGVSQARNQGVLNSNFDYLSFLDGDDEWDEIYLEKVLEAFRKYPEAGMVCTAGIVKHTNGQQADRLAIKYKDQIIEVNFFENPHVFSHTSAIVVSKKIFNAAKGFPVGMRNNEDYTFSYSVGLISKVVYCGFKISIYNGGIDGQATKINSGTIYSDLDMIKRHNITFKLWDETKRGNSLFLVFIRYEIRHTILTALKCNNYFLIDLLSKNLEKDILSNFKFFEFRLYSIKFTKRIAILYIYLTKLVWRLNGFPYLGQ
jgi:glycosyltransferase involved in cell wall biosynthesis